MKPETDIILLKKDLKEISKDLKDMAGNVGKLSTYAANTTRTDNRDYVSVGGSVHYFQGLTADTDSDVGLAFSEITANAEL